MKTKPDAWSETMTQAVSGETVSTVPCTEAIGFENVVPRSSRRPWPVPAYPWAPLGPKTNELGGVGTLIAVPFVSFGTVIGIIETLHFLTPKQSVLLA